MHSLRGMLISLLIITRQPKNGSLCIRFNRYDLCNEIIYHEFEH